MGNPFMARAIQIAVENVRAGRGGPFGALVVKDGRTIAEGYNAVTFTNDPTAHAEMMAIRQACRVLEHFQLNGCEIYTSCEPCPMCLAAIYWARPLRVFFANTSGEAGAIGFDDSLIYAQLQLPPAERRIPMISIMHDEGMAAFREWQQKGDKIPY